MIVREFRRDDLPQCLDLNKIQHKESNFRDLPLDLHKLKNSYLNAINNPRLKVFVMEVDGKIVGCCAVSLNQYLWNYDCFVSDHFYYIYPEHRRGMAALKLYKAVHDWAKSNRAVEIHFNYAHGNDNRMDLLLGKLGYKKYSENYRKMVI
jgi:L-amino acid N-acyltransferase YncA